MGLLLERVYSPFRLIVALFGGISMSMSQYYLLRFYNYFDYFSWNREGMINKRLDM